jgi:2-methylcitrate dehydratase PrpD
MLDWVGVALVGSAEPLSRILRDQALEEGGHQQATLLGTDIKLSIRQAALVNGAAGHAIDYDDANFDAQGHVTAAVLPAVLAVAQARSLGGADVLRAFAAGYEVAGMVGTYVGREHYDRGFHGTVTVGSFGAACGASVLLGLDARTMSVALGIAGTQAAGLKAQFGTMCKPLHAGKANENGVTAALLAQHGFTGRTDLIEAPQGFAAATSPTTHVEAVLASRDGRHHLAQNLFKYHAACYGTHASIEAVRSLVQRHALRVEDIVSIELDVEAGADHMCNIARPRSGLEAKFSLCFNAALAAAGRDTASPATYDDAIPNDPALRALRDRVTVRLMPSDWPRMLAEARVTTADGRRLSARHDSGVPDADLARQGARVRAKFLSLVSPIVGDSKAEAIATAIDTLEQLEDIGSLMALLR